MALVKYGGGVTQLSGSIAGNTFARNRFGNYVRPRTKPVNPNSALQVIVRGILASLAELWHSALDATERGSWATYAAAVAAKNRLGEVIYLTGFNHFIRGNSIRTRVGQPVVEAGPTVLALPETDPTFNIVCSVADQTIAVTFDPLLPYHVEATGVMAVFMGVPRLTTRNFFNGPWQYAGQIVHDDITGKKLPAPMALVLGQKVTCYSRISRMDGRLSEPMVKTCLVTA